MLAEEPQQTCLKLPSVGCRPRVSKRPPTLRSGATSAKGSWKPLARQGRVGRLEYEDSKKWHSKSRCTEEALTQEKVGFEWKTQRQATEC